MTQVQVYLWDVQDRDGVWRKRTGRKAAGGWSGRNICPIQAFPLNSPVDPPGKKQGGKGWGGDGGPDTSGTRDRDV